MIRSFADRRTERIFARDATSWPSKPIRRAALIHLEQIHNAASLNDLRASRGNRLEKLKGNRAGQYSIRINNQWRVCFTWRHPNAFDVEVSKHYDR